MPLDDPDHARHAWARYRRLMAWMALASAGAVVVGLLALGWLVGPVPMHMAIATSLGVFFAVLLAAALMGLVFLSAGTGHDAEIQDFSQDEPK